MIFAKRHIALAGGYTEGATFRLAREIYAVKLSIRVRDTAGNIDANAILQVSENVEQFFENESETEQLLEPGFHSRTYPRPITAWRFKLENPANIAEIDFVAYGV